MRAGYTPWTLLDFAESKGIRVRQVADTDNLEQRIAAFDDLTLPFSPPSKAAMQRQMDAASNSGSAEAGATGRGRLRKGPRRLNQQQR